MSKKILVVCAGNSQRSQALSHYIREYGKANGLDLEVKSAGVSVDSIKKHIAEHGASTPMTDKAIRAQDRLIPELLDEQGESRRIDGTMKPITRELVEEADIIIAVEPYIRKKICILFPDVEHKIRIAKDLAAEKDVNARFIDPYSSKENQPYRRNSIKDNPKTGQTIRANLVMANEAHRLAKRIVPKIMRL